MTAPALLALLLAAPPVALVHVVMTTELGEIELEVDVPHAPVTGTNFLRYVREGRYDGGRFHRTVRADNQPRNPVKIDVVQAGVAPEKSKKDHAPIRLERTRNTGLHHVDGTLSMARAQPDTATSDFFVCIGPQPELDFGGRRNPDGQGFAAFGRVVKGMDVIRKIHQAPAKDQALEPPVRIVKARISD